MSEQLLIHFLTKTCSDSEIQEIDEWISKSKENADWLFEMEHIWSLKNELKYSQEDKVEIAYVRFSNYLNEKESTSKIKKHSVLYYLKYVAAIVIFCILSISIYKMQRQDESIAMNTIEVPNGQKVSLTLSDGTKIWLNAQSKLTYPSSFSKKSRTVTLEGEGFFEVTHDQKRPFIVKSSLLDIKVLGTKFNVKGYNGESAFVSLIEGSVEVSTENKDYLTLKPNEQAFASKDGGLSRIENMDAGFTSQWIEGELYFVNQQLQDILKELERKYNTKIIIQDSQLASVIFNCHTQADATLIQVLDLLKDTRKMNYKIENNKVLIFKNKK